VPQVWSLEALNKSTVAPRGGEGRSTDHGRPGTGSLAAPRRIPSRLRNRRGGRELVRYEDATRWSLLDLDEESLICGTADTIVVGEGLARQYATTVAGSRTAIRLAARPPA